ncbi:MAG TPA: hypothetical protein VGJ48_16350 [Pyrinomonadaceae bacterium]
MSLAFLHPGDLAISDWLALIWYWLGIPLVVVLGILLLAKFGKWSGRNAKGPSNRPKT